MERRWRCCRPQLGERQRRPQAVGWLQQHECHEADGGKPWAWHPGCYEHYHARAPSRSRRKFGSFVDRGGIENGRDEPGQEQEHEQRGKYSGHGRGTTTTTTRPTDRQSQIAEEVKGWPLAAPRSTPRRTPCAARGAPEAFRAQSPPRARATPCSAAQSSAARKAAPPHSPPPHSPPCPA
eukprot:scaffold85075_cov56-Phaeocystis_antarctica.AAC.2